MSTASSKIIACALGLLTAVVLTGCGGSAAKPPLVFGYADNGRMVTLPLGRRAVIRLDTLNWTFAPITGPAVRATVPQRLVYVTKGCNASNGCGYTELTVDAVARGRSVIGAERLSCGEAARCPPALRKFALTVVVH